MLSLEYCENFQLLSSNTLSSRGLFNLTSLGALIFLFAFKRRLNIFKAYAGEKTMQIIGVYLGAFLYTAFLLSCTIIFVNTSLDTSTPVPKLSEVTIFDDYWNGRTEYSYSVLLEDDYVKIITDFETYDRFKKLYDSKIKISARYIVKKGFLRIPWVNKKEFQLMTQN